MEIDRALEIINKTSLKGRGVEPTAFLEYEDDKPIAELGWNHPKDARWFFALEIAVMILEERNINRILIEENQQLKRYKKFAEHIHNHSDKGMLLDDWVVCKICNKTFSEIVKDEIKTTNKR